MKLLFFLSAVMTAALLTLPVLLLDRDDTAPVQPPEPENTVTDSAADTTAIIRADTMTGCETAAAAQVPVYMTEAVSAAGSASVELTVSAADIIAADTQPPAPDEVNTADTANGYDATVLLTLDSGAAATEITLRDYLCGIVMAEMPSYFSEEALRAQAVAARTYVLYRAERGLVLSDNSASCTAYMTEDDARAFFDEHYDTVVQRITAAVEATDGLVLTYEDMLCCTVFHAMSCGRTESSEALWGQSYPYLVSVETPEDTALDGMVTTAVFDEGALCARLGVTAALPLTFVQTQSGRIASAVTASGDAFSGEQLRTRLGLRSTDITVAEQDSAALTLTVCGWGHGVGMSQYGADALADAGYAYADILAHYYPGSVLAQHSAS